MFKTFSFVFQVTTGGERMKGWMFVVFLGMVALMLQPNVLAQEEEWEEVLDIVSGKVANLDLTGNKIKITDTEGQIQEFTLDPNLTTVWDDTADEEKELSNLEVGKEVVVEFRVDENGIKIASWIDIVAVEEELPETEVEELEVEESVEE